jgi:hypothetical protein
MGPGWATVGIMAHSAKRPPELQSGFPLGRTPRPHRGRPLTGIIQDHVRFDSITARHGEALFHLERSSLQR